MKTFENIEEFRVKAVSIAHHYKPIGTYESGEEKIVEWISVDGMSFNIPGYEKTISIDSEGHSTHVGLMNGRIYIDSYKGGVDVEHFLSCLEEEDEETALAEALKIDFEQFQSFDLKEVYLVADHEEMEDLGPWDFMITSLEIHFDDGTFVEATDKQLVNLYLQEQRDKINHQLKAV